MTTNALYISFFELQGSEAFYTLRDLSQDLANEEVVVEQSLLQSTQQRDLWLLVCHSTVQLDLDLRDDIRQWHFAKAVLDD